MYRNKINLEQQKNNNNVQNKNKFGELPSLVFQTFKAIVIKSMVLGEKKNTWNNETKGQKIDLHTLLNKSSQQFNWRKKNLPTCGIEATNIYTYIREK